MRYPHHLNLHSRHVWRHLFSWESGSWLPWRSLCTVFFFFNDTATTEIYTLSLHDALPICPSSTPNLAPMSDVELRRLGDSGRSEEHTSELQSQSNIVCRLLLEKTKTKAGGRSSASSYSAAPRWAGPSQFP